MIVSLIEAAEGSEPATTGCQQTTPDDDIPAQDDTV